MGTVSVSSPSLVLEVDINDSEQQSHLVRTPPWIVPSTSPLLRLRGVCVTLSRALMEPSATSMSEAVKVIVDLTGTMVDKKLCKGYDLYG